MRKTAFQGGYKRITRETNKVGKRGDEKKRGRQLGEEAGESDEST